MSTLRRVSAEAVAAACRSAVDPATLARAREIVDDVRTHGIDAVRRYAVQFGERLADEPLVLGPDVLARALAETPTEERALLERTAARIERFATAQRQALHDVTVDVPGGQAGHTVVPISAVGCYAPGGRYPLPSSVLMTALTARVAGCPRVVVASPGASRTMLAAAALSGADQFLAVGGAHAIAALAFGMEGMAPCDSIVGPGNRWVTMAKHLLVGTVGIDMLAGPSELLVLADGAADPALIAADLLAQAEHDVDAVPMLVATSAAVVEAVEQALSLQLPKLPTRAVARQALSNGWACVVPDVPTAIRLANRIAPEHLQIMTEDASHVAQAIRTAGAIFVGADTAEVFGDYGAGPNHTLPTGGAARFQSALSVQHFVRFQTWLRIDDSDRADEVRADARRLAEIEGLTGHAAAAGYRGGRRRVSG